MIVCPKPIFVIVAFLACMVCLKTNADDMRPALGSIVSNLTFRDIRGLDRNLAELGEHKAYVFIFTTILSGNLDMSSHRETRNSRKAQ